MIPACECLKDTVARVLPFWTDSIAPAIKVNMLHNNIEELITEFDRVNSVHFTSLKYYWLLQYLDFYINNYVIYINFR